MNDMLRRNAALQKTVNKYRGKAFAWGKFDCVNMARSHLVAMKHRKLPKLPRYKNALGAKRALKKMGHNSLESLFDSLLPRIAPAEMLPGDIVMMEGEETFDAISISTGYKTFGWHGDTDKTVIMVPLEIKAAWRA